MKKPSTLYAICTYILIVFLVVGINLICYSPISQLKESAKIVQRNYENEINSIEINKNNQEVVDINSEYNLEVQDHYKNFGRVFINMIVALLVVVSLTLVVFGLSRRVNTNRNKGIYNAIIIAGITCIFYLIWFVVNVSNSFELLF